MSQVMTFVNILAWVAGIISSLWVVAAWIGSALYKGDRLGQARDMLNGVKRTYPWGKPAVVAIICWAWIIAGYCTQ